MVDGGRDTGKYLGAWGNTVRLCFDTRQMCAWKGMKAFRNFTFFECTFFAS